MHAEPGRVLRDVGRYTRLVDLGWRIYRYTKLDVYGDPGRIVAELTRARPDARDCPQRGFVRPTPLSAISGPLRGGGNAARAARWAVTCSASPATPSRKLDERRDCHRSPRK